MTDLIVFVEEPSASIVIDELGRRFAPDRSITVVSHNGKNDLRDSFPGKIKGWRHPSDAQFMVLHDKDSHPDCRALKTELLLMAPAHKRSATSIRIVMSELEAWYLSDPQALASAQLISESQARKMTRSRKFRNPEMLNNAKQEFLKLHAMRGQQRLLARQIAPHLDPERSVSTSFKLVVESLRG